MTLPIALSVPHAGCHIPDEAADYCQLTLDQIVKDGDEFAAEIYDLGGEVAEFITTDIARAIVDLNRAPDDRRADGVIKTHTIFDEPIYREPLPETVANRLLEKYYHPYHTRLGELAGRDLLFAVDCHTMTAVAPPIGPDPGSKRPEVCLGNLHGRSFSDAWTAVLYEALHDAFTGFSVTLNKPFAGGYITRTHSGRLPLVQVEVSRSGFLPNSEVRERFLKAIRQTCHKLNR